MKKICSVFFALFLFFAVGITSFAAEEPIRLFSVAPEKETSAEEVFSYAAEKSFGGILLDMRGNDSKNFYKDLKNLCTEDFLLYVFSDESDAKKYSDSAKIVIDSGFSEEAVLDIFEKTGADNLCFYLSFEDLKSFETAKYFYEKGYFKTVFAENFYSCHSENGYETYLLKIAEAFPNAKIITVNDLGKVLMPSAKGDFYADQFELINQYLVNKIGGFGFCVNDYSDLKANLFGNADFLTDYFNSEILDEYADFSVSQKLEITRPTGSKLYVETEKYTIFGTSDPEKPLYMNGEEIERISESGLFAVTVETAKKGRTYNFSQGNKKVSVTLYRGTASSSGSGTTKKLTSCAPSASVILDSESTEVTLSCVGPSGGKITAKIGDITVNLKQVAYADKGVPARFTATVDLSGEYPENEVTEIGKVTYTLKFGGNTTTYESSAAYYYVGSTASFAVRANVELAGVEKKPGDNGNYITTLRTGCADYVTEISENGWYKISCGGFIKPSQCDVITGITDITADIYSVDREVGENYEKLVIKSSEIPTFTGKINGRTFSITLYNTNWSDFSSTDMESELMYRINPVDNGDGSITVNFFSKTALWGWDFFTDPENGSFSIVLKGTPTLSDDPEKPLLGTTVAVCAGHGGPDPGALSVAGEKGVNEAQINLVNTLTIAESLEKLGAQIVLIISDGTKLDTYGRTDPARYAYCDAYICCHANSVAENSAANLWCGTYVYYHFDHSAVFSKNLCDYISASTNRDNEGAVQDYYSVTRLTMCPAVMLEVGFVSNPKEFESLMDKTDIQKTANAVTKAVIELFDN